MYPPPPTGPEPAAGHHDPLAVALGNASLLGVGYVLLGRRWLAIGAGLVTAALVATLARVARSWWFEAVVLLWWAAVTVHGWRLAAGRLWGWPSASGGVPDQQPAAGRAPGGWLASGGRPRRLAGARGERLIALGVTVPVLLTVGLLRVDASRIESNVAEARRAGDCGRALTLVDGLGAGHRVADAPLAARVEDTERACQLLRTATDDLTAGLTGDTAALRAGFDRLGTVLAELPGHQEMVRAALETFLDSLPTGDPCVTATITDWLGERPADGGVLDRVGEVAPWHAPPALVGCGDALIAAGDWPRARARYQQLLAQYPGHAYAGKARAGVDRASRAIELANVRELLETSSATTQPEYCDKPAPYRGAAPYRRGRVNRALLFGDDEYTSKLPAGWRARGVADAVLVICVDEAEFGDRVRTCPYESELSVMGYQDVTFRKVAIPIRAYEVRTGRLVADTKLQISGKSCPRVLKYTTYLIGDLGPPSEVHVTPSTSNVRAAFRSLIAPR